MLEHKQSDHNFKILCDLVEGFAELDKTGTGLVEVTHKGEPYMDNVYPSEQLACNFIGLNKNDEV
ncbi:hypothetical protein RA276_31615, partial [Pseudomonas syringae pv. tagetis]